MRWTLRRELGEREAKVAARLKRTGRLYVFLREVQPDLFDEAFQAELDAAYGVARGTEPIPPALLAMVMLLQARLIAHDLDKKLLDRTVEIAIAPRRRFRSPARRCSSRRVSSFSPGQA